MKLVTASMTKQELLDAIEECQAELDFRRNEEKRKLITDFENAFFAMKDAHIAIRYTDGTQGAYGILIDDIDCFEFE